MNSVWLFGLYNIYTYLCSSLSCTFPWEALQWLLYGQRPLKKMSGLEGRTSCSYTGDSFFVSTISLPRPYPPGWPVATIYHMGSWTGCIARLRRVDCVCGRGGHLLYIQWLIGLITAIWIYPRGDFLRNPLLWSIMTTHFRDLDLISIF